MYPLMFCAPHHCSAERVSAFSTASTRRGSAAPRLHDDTPAHRRAAAVAAATRVRRAKRCMAFGSSVGTSTRILLCTLCQPRAEPRTISAPPDGKDACSTVSVGSNDSSSVSLRKCRAFALRQHLGGVSLPFCNPFDLDRRLLNNPLDPVQSLAAADVVHICSLSRKTLYLKPHRSHREYEGHQRNVAPDSPILLHTAPTTRTRILRVTNPRTSQPRTAFARSLRARLTLIRRQLGADRAFQPPDGYTSISRRTGAN